MNIEKIKYEIKEEEGYRDIMYKDHLGFATIGYGHLVLPTDKFKEGVRYDRKNLDQVFNYDFQIAYQDAMDLCKDLDIVDEAKEIIIHMCFQLGKPKTAKFKKMFEALRNKDYIEAGLQMESSLWYKQTPNRVMRLSEKMKKLT
jgi:GH24 family phage-related lysozyme (muramidase)